MDDHLTFQIRRVASPLQLSIEEVWMTSSTFKQSECAPLPEVLSDEDDSIERCKDQDGHSHFR